MPPADAPRVTVMVPTFNQAEFVAEAVDSAVRQTYPNLDVVVADDASTDDTPGVLARFSGDGRVRVVRRERNLGRAANYRRALREDATGDWVINLDGDDFFTDDDFIARALRAAGACGGAVLAVGGCRMLEADGRWRDVLATRAESACVDGVEYFLGWGASLGAPHMAALYPRDLALSLDFYRFDIISCDWESLRRLVLRGRVALVGGVAGVWRQRDAGESRSAGVAQRLADLRGIDAPHDDALALGVDRARLDRWRRRAVAEHVALGARAFVLRGELGRARELLAAVRRERPRDYAACLAGLAARPSVWAWAALAAVSGRRGVGAAWRAWKRLTWRD